MRQTLVGLYNPYGARSPACVIPSLHSPQRRVKLHIYMHRSLSAQSGGYKRIVDHAVDIPLPGRSRAVSGNIIISLYIVGKSLILAQSLTVILVNPLYRAVGRHHNQRHLAVICLGYRRSIIQQSRARCADKHYRTPCHGCLPEGDKSSTALVDDNSTAY